MNIFKNVLNKLQIGKINIIENDRKDKKIAEQLEKTLNWHVVKSRSDSNPFDGCPMGQILCRNIEEAKEYVENSTFNDLYIEDYSKINTNLDLNI